MRRQFSPDYVTTTSSTTNLHCHDPGDGVHTVTGTTASLDEGGQADPAPMSPDFNSQYYNPEVRYLPAINYDGTQRTSMTSVDTSAWTRVPTDSISTAGENSARKNLHSADNWDMDTPTTATVEM